MSTDVESAVPPHLGRPRTIPTRKGDQFVPPYPSFSARFTAATTSVVMAYFGLQHPDGETVPAVARAALDGLRASLAGPEGARSVDLAEYVDEAGYRTRLVIAYWDDPSSYERWTAAGTGWTDASHAGSGVGRFLEVVRPSVERFETLFSNDRVEGVSRLADGLSGPIREHAYWGGARDRMPLGQDDALRPSGAPQLTVDGPLRTVTIGHNPCLIRSGQEWTETAGDERRMYLEDVEPHLRAGMDFLRDDGLPVGCYVNRYVTVLDDDEQPTDRSFGLSWWHSMAELDAWAESHPTHLRIFGAAMKYLSTTGPAAKLRLYHEVTVPAAEETTFSYLDCHDRTGLLRAFAG